MTRYSVRPIGLSWCVSSDSATRASWRILRILRCSGRCAATTSSPSRPTHTTVTWGLPSGFRVTRWARAADSRTARALSGSDAIPAMLASATTRPPAWLRCSPMRLLDADPGAEFGALADLAHDARGRDVEDMHGQGLPV